MGDRTTTGHTETACGKLYVNCVWTKDGKVKKIFAHLGKSGTCSNANLDAHSHAAKIMLRADIPLETVLKCYKGCVCYNQHAEALSCIDGFGKILEQLVTPKAKESKT